MSHGSWPVNNCSSIDTEFTSNGIDDVVVVIVGADVDGRNVGTGSNMVVPIVNNFAECATMLTSMILYWFAIMHLVQ